MTEQIFAFLLALVENLALFKILIALGFIMLLGDNISSTACVHFIGPYCFSLRLIHFYLSEHSSVVSLLVTFSKL